MIKLEQDLCFFDIESTGADVVKDRIIQIALVKYPKDGGPAQERCYVLNPEHPIHPEAQRIHGFSAEMLQDKPTFKLIAVELLNFLENCDLAGYNSNKFDLPLLIAEFGRIGLPFSTEGRKLIDAMQIFYKMEPRNLRAAYRFYCGKDLANAHDALADTKATAEVFFGQVQRYQNPENLHAEVPGQETAFESIANLHDFLHDASRVDFTGRFIRNSEGLIVFNFGAKKGEPAHKHPQVLHWMIDKDFPAQVKEIAKAILAGKMK